MREFQPFETPRPADERVGGIDGETFRRAFRALAGGVCVITAGDGGRRTGLTATSVTSLSADPPSVLFCVNREASAAAVIVEEGRFGLNILAAHQSPVADRFAGKGGCKGALRYEGAQWRTLTTGVSLLVGAPAALDCVVTEAIERHSHLIVIGRVVDALTPGHGGALVYRNGAYRRFDESAPADPGRLGFC
jgi:flavin reductase (DIM6/NTAB) family NADH-FMN oxidoreductase RutF